MPTSTVVASFSRLQKYVFVRDSIYLTDYPEYKKVMIYIFLYIVVQKIKFSIWMSKKNESNEGLEKQIRKKKLVVGTRQQKRRIKFYAEEIDGLFSSTFVL